MECLDRELPVLIVVALKMLTKNTSNFNFNHCFKESVNTWLVKGQLYSANNIEMLTADKQVLLLAKLHNTAVAKV